MLTYIIAVIQAFVSRMYERVLASITHMIVFAAEIVMVLTSMMFLMVICG